MGEAHRMVREIAKAYEPRQIEPRWADFWVKEALFKADVNAPGPVFSIVIPPPNVTGSLHIGHMLEHTEIDILTRWHRMREYNTLYLPGTDHAGISTQRVVVKHLMDRGIDYHTLGREEFGREEWKREAEAGNDAGGYSRGGKSGRRTVYASCWQEGVAAIDESRNSDSRGCDGRPRVWNGRGKDSPGARSK